MSFLINSQQYVSYLHMVAAKLRESKDYVTSLDAATGDGDHWANLMAGFDAIEAECPAMESMPLCSVFQRIGMLMVSQVGGSSGILYGGAYIAAAKGLKGKVFFNASELCESLGLMVQDMMKRGKAEPGYKTMIDAIYPAWKAFEKGLAIGLEDLALLEEVKAASLAGAEATRGMEAVKGRASYRTDKGVGFLDAGAVTMSYQIVCLCDTIKANL